MHIPGFMAELSLAPARNHYRQSAMLGMTLSGASNQQVLRTMQLVRRRALMGRVAFGVLGFSAVGFARNG